MRIIEDIRRVVYSLFGHKKLDQAGFKVEISKDLERCDLTTNVALVLSKVAGRSPLEVATVVVDALMHEGASFIRGVKIEGPGFINIFLHKDAWLEVLGQINEEKASYGCSDEGAGLSVNLEFVSANPTGPMHIGHARGAVLFDVLGNLMSKVGYKVTKEYYVNDCGSQIEKLITTAFYRYQEILGRDSTISTEFLYPGVYLKVVGKELVDKYGEDLLSMQETERKPLLRKYVLNSMMSLVKKDLSMLKVVHDNFVYESVVASDEKIESLIKFLKEKDLVYEGVLEPPKSLSDPEEWGSEKNLLFRAKKFGDSSDRSLTKGGADWTYFAKDIAYHYYKIKRGFGKLIVGLGQDHFGYKKRLKACVQALSGGEQDLDVQLYNIVKFMDDGVPIKMSKRSGSFLSVWDVVNRLGSDVVRFTMLTRHHSVDLTFDFAKALEQSKDNPVFYVQYAYARSSSLLAKAESMGVELKSVDLQLIKTDHELNLIKCMSSWPGVVSSSVKSSEPHRVVFYLTTLVEVFHTLWSMGKSDYDFKFLDENNLELTKARLFLVRAFRYVLASGMEVLNLEPIEKM